MLRQIPKVLLLVALLTALVASGIPARAGAGNCGCFQPVCFFGHCKPAGHCDFDKKTSQCVNANCSTYCFMTVP